MAQEVMPAKAARYGVWPVTRMPISSTSGISVGQSLAQDSLSLGISSAGQAPQPVPLGLEMHLHEHPEEVHEGRYHSRGDDGLVGDD